MKKSLLKRSIVALAAFGFCLTSCGGKGSGYQEFLNAKDNAIVTVETYIQAKFTLNAWGSTNIYAQDSEGGYYVYRYYCDQTQYDALKIGQKVKITGTRASWSGENEFGESHDTKIEVLDGNWVAKPKDMTKYVGTDEMIKFQNQLVAFPKAKVLAYKDTGKPFSYKGDARGDDIYIQISCNDVTIECCVETDFTDSNSELYKTVEGLKVGDVIRLEGFLNWYNMPNPHVYKIKK